MSDDPSTPNPYASPESNPVPVVSGVDTGNPPSRSFRYRVVPVVPAVFFGVLFSLGGLLIVGRLFWDAWIMNNPIYHDEAMRDQLRTLALALFTCFTIGISLLASARQWWRGRWISAIVLMVIASAAFLGLSWLGL